MNVVSTRPSGSGYLPAGSPDDYGVRQKAAWDQKDFESLFQQRSGPSLRHAEGTGKPVDDATPPTAKSVDEMDSHSEGRFPIPFSIASDPASVNAKAADGGPQAADGEFFSSAVVARFGMEPARGTVADVETPADCAMRARHVRVDDTKTDEHTDENLHVSVQGDSVQISIRDGLAAEGHARDVLAVAIRVELAYHGLTLGSLKINGQLAPGQTRVARLGASPQSLYDQTWESETMESGGHHVR